MNLSVATDILNREFLSSINEDDALRIFMKFRWDKTNGEPICPHCGYMMVYSYKARRIFKCKGCNKQFSATTKTAFRGHKLSFKQIVYILMGIREGQFDNANQLTKETGIQLSTSYNIYNSIAEEDMNRLSPENVEKIKNMACSGFSIRDIASVMEVSKVTVGKYALSVSRPDTVSDYSKKSQETRNKKQHYLNCGYCNARFLDKNGEKTSDIKCGRIKMAYCTHRCAMNYRSKQRHDDKCKRCARTRKELAVFKLADYEATGVCFVRGFCHYCYTILSMFNFDEITADAYQFNQTLKKEIRHGK